MCVFSAPVVLGFWCLEKLLTLCFVALDTGPLECPSVRVSDAWVCVLQSGKVSHTELMFRLSHCLTCEEIHAVV